jgi:uracil-DNA glycosylase
MDWDDELIGRSQPSGHGLPPVPPVGGMARAVAFEKRKAYRQWEYWGKPVPGFGDPQARLLIVGLAPGAHGSNRTGRMFTGDSSGDFLFPALHRAGFASQPGSVQLNDDLTLKDAYITAVGRCAPPDNKPTPAELSACRPYLLAELELLWHWGALPTISSAPSTRPSAPTPLPTAHSPC